MAAKVKSRCQAGAGALNAVMVRRQDSKERLQAA